MNTIYELKNQIYTQLVSETNKFFHYLVNNNKDNSFQSEEVKTQIPLVKEQVLKVDLAVETIKLESRDSKSCYYGIGFNLLLNINNKLYKEEKLIYGIIEKILMLLHSMECYYCYKINNCNIKTEIPLYTSINTEPFIIKIKWITNVNLDNNWFN